VTQENRRRNAAAELQRAATCLNEAKQLQSAMFPYGAASRAYYAVFHAARGLLFSIGIDVSSHKGVVSMIGEHFVRPGHLPSQMGRLVSRMQRDREDADYSTGPQRRYPSVTHIAQPAQQPDGLVFMVREANVQRIPRLLPRDKSSHGVSTW
jgi:uncharacterized protein (UPF0332 family)